MNNKFEILENLLLADRSVRRFDESHSIERTVLDQIIGLVRLCASGRNLQPLRYYIVTKDSEKEALFPALAWAGYYKDWDGPSKGERPSAYIVQCLDTELADDCLCDDGLQLQAITLGATACGLSCCIIKAFNPKMVTESVNLPDRYRPRYVVAIGQAAENISIVDLPDNGDYRYYRDEDDTQCVPKRPVESIIIN